MIEPVILLLSFAISGFAAWYVLQLVFALGEEQAREHYLAHRGDVPRNDPNYYFTTPARLATARFLAVLVAGVITLVALSLVSFVRWPYPLLLAALVGGLASRVPSWWVQRSVRKRLQAFEARLMDFIFALISSLKAGAGISECMRVSSETFEGPIAEEFNILLQEERLTDLDEALNNLCTRMPSEDLKLLSTSIKLARTTGATLSDVLEKIAITIRARNDLKENLRSKTSQGRAQAYILAAVPFLLFFVMNLMQPEMMKPVYTTLLGWFAIGITLCLQLIGFFWMKRILNIEA